MKIYLVTPKNPTSFWTYDEILPVLGKRCIFPNLSMPTVAGLTPSPHEVVLCDENVEEIDFDVEADIVGVTGYIVHRERMLEIIDEFRRRGRFVVVGGPFASLCPEQLRGRCDALVRGGGRGDLAPVPGGLRGRRPQERVPAGREAGHDALADAAFRSAPRRPLPRAHHPVRARLPLQLRVLRHHRRLRPAAAREERRAGDARGPRVPSSRRAPDLHRRRQLHREPEAGEGAAARARALRARARLSDRPSRPRSRSTSRRTRSCSRSCAPRTSPRSSSGSRARAGSRSRRPRRPRTCAGIWSRTCGRSSPTASRCRPA